MECDTKGVAPDPARCNRAGVRRYPTWVLGKNRHEGLLTLDEYEVIEEEALDALEQDEEGRWRT